MHGLRIKGFSRRDDVQVMQRFLNHFFPLCPSGPVSQKREKRSVVAPMRSYPAAVSFCSTRRMAECTPLANLLGLVLVRLLELEFSSRSNVVLGLWHDRTTTANMFWIQFGFGE